MSVQTKHRFNVTEYYRMAETGVLRTDARVELLNGESMDRSPIGPFHGSITKHLKTTALPATQAKRFSVRARSSRQWLFRMPSWTWRIC